MPKAVFAETTLPLNILSLLSKVVPPPDVKSDMLMPMLLLLATQLMIWESTRLKISSPAPVPELFVLLSAMHDSKMKGPLTGPRLVPANCGPRLENPKAKPLEVPGSTFPEAMHLLNTAGPQSLQRKK